MEMPLGLQALMPDVGRCQPVCNGTKGYLQKLSLVPMNQSQKVPSIPDKDQPRHGLMYYVRIRVDGQLHEDKAKLRSSDFTPAPWFMWHVRIGKRGRGVPVRVGPNPGIYVPVHLGVERVVTLRPRQALATFVSLNYSSLLFQPAANTR